MQEWFRELNRYNELSERVAHQFVLWGNIFDYQKMPTGSEKEYGDLIQFMIKSFEKDDHIVMFYSTSAGLEFSKQTKTLKKILNKHLGRATYEHMLSNKTPQAILPFLEKILTSKDYTEPKEGEAKKLIRKTLIIEYAEDMIPQVDNAMANPEHRFNIQTLDRWSRNLKMRDAGSTVVINTPNLYKLATNFRSNYTATVSIRLKKPDAEEKKKYLSQLISKHGISLKNGLTVNNVAMLTNGLSLSQLARIFLFAQHDGDEINLETLRESTQNIIESEVGHLFKIKLPRLTFKDYGGRPEVKEYFNEVYDDIKNGILRRVPMGILMPGPPGTGKTYFCECLAGEWGIIFIEFKNIRSKYLGESEAQLQEALAIIEDLAPCVVIEDEADQSEPARGSGSSEGDGGVTSRIREMKMKFFGDTSHRGKIIRIMMTNRMDLIDSAFKRGGRTDIIIPFTPSRDTEEWRILFEVNYKIKEIPTEITDFSKLAIQVIDKECFTPAELATVVLESDRIAGRAKADFVAIEHLEQALENWRTGVDPYDFHFQTVMSLDNAHPDLKPKGSDEVYEISQARLTELKQDRMMSRLEA